MPNETVQLSVTSTQINTGITKANAITKTAEQINASLTLADSAIQPTDIATTSDLGVVKVDGTTITISDGVISSSGGGGSVDDVQIEGTTIVSSGVANIPYATTGTAGVVRANNGYGTAMSNAYIISVIKNATQYASSNTAMFVSKGTLDNVVTGIPNTITDSSTTALAKNNIYTIAEATALTVTYPASPDNSFIAELDFTSGTTPTTLTLPSGTKCIGDDCTGGNFTPVASKRYTCLFYYDGVNFRCLVSGVA